MHHDPFEAALYDHVHFTNLTHLTAGDHATVYRIDRADQPPILVKRYHKAKYFDRAVNALGLLSRYAAPVPALLETHTIAGEGVVFQVWWEGQPLEPIFASLSASEQLHVLAQAGAMLARVQHSIPADTLFQASFWHRNELINAQHMTWQAYITATAQKSLKRIRESTLQSDRVLMADLDRVAIMLPQIAPPAALTLLHADFVLRNIFMRTGGNSVAGVIDFDVALLGDPVYDLAKLTWADLDPENAVGRERFIDAWQAETGYSIAPGHLALYESIQAITSLGWIVKQTTNTVELQLFRQRAIAALSRNRALLG